MSVVALAVRPADPVDAPGIARLHHETALHAFAGIFPPEAPAPTVGGLTVDWAGRLDAGPPQLVTVAEQASGLVGVVAAGPDPDEPGVGHLARLYVLPAEWGRGIGRRLHDAALAHLRDRGHPEATLWVLEANHRARCWYERLGWRPTPARKPTYAPANILDIAYRHPL